MNQKVANVFAFVCVIAGVIGYANYEDSTQTVAQGITNKVVTPVVERITNKEAITMTQEIVKTYSPLILKDLGVGDDGILNRITISDKVPMDDDYSGLFTDRSYTSWSDGRITYDQGTDSIDLYPYMNLTERDEKGDPVFLQKDQYPSKDEFRKETIETLAHELRHYWQDQTGESLKHPYDTSIPHDKRWAEIDANQYAEKYYQSIQNK
jgi:hypothetical protein